MAIPLLQAYKVGRYIAGRKIRGIKRYPLVLMLEPLFQCNLACSGCGKIDHSKEILQKRLSVEDALRAIHEGDGALHAFLVVTEESALERAPHLPVPLHEECALLVPRPPVAQAHQALQPRVLEAGDYLDGHRPI